MIHNRLHQNILEASKNWNYLCKKYFFLQVGEMYHFPHLNDGCFRTQSRNTRYLKIVKFSEKN